MTAEPSARTVDDDAPEDQQLPRDGQPADGAAGASGAAARAQGGYSLPAKLGVFVVGVVLVGVTLGGLLGLAVGVVAPRNGLGLSGTPPTVDPAGGIPPASDAGGQVGSVDGGPFGIFDVTPFDPQGDEEENGGQTRASWDGDPESGWPTEQYDSSSFAGLKDGVGLIFDLGAPQPVGRVDVQVDGTTGLALYAADAVPETLRGFERVATAEPASGTLTIGTDEQRARFWLVWVTRLPSDGQAFLNEVTFVP